jgi:pilus assembly protein CpaE
MGDVLVFLDLASRYGFAEVLKNLHRLDEELLHRSLTEHATGLRVLAQSDQLEDADDLDARSVVRVISFLRQHYDYVVLDGLRDFSERALAALDLADKVALVMTQDIPALKNAGRCLALFRQLGYGPDKVKLTLNRYHKRGKLDLDSISDALGADVNGTVANDFPTVIGAINTGELLFKAAPRARVTRDIQALLPVFGVAAGHQRRGLLGRLAR